MTTLSFLALLQAALDGLVEYAPAKLDKHNPRLVSLIGRASAEIVRRVKAETKNKKGE